MDTPGIEQQVSNETGSDSFSSDWGGIPRKGAAKPNALFPVQVPPPVVAHCILSFEHEA